MDRESVEFGIRKVSSTTRCDEYTRSIKYVSRQFLLSPDYKGRKYTLLTILFYGLCGSVFVDFDHFFINQAQRVRPFHLEVFVLVWCVYICYNAYHTRLFYKLVLRKSENETK